MYLGWIFRAYSAHRHGWRNRGGGETGRDLPLRAPSIPFPGWDPGDPIYTKMGPFYHWRRNVTKWWGQLNFESIFRAYHSSEDNWYQDIWYPDKLWAYLQILSQFWRYLKIGSKFSWPHHFGTFLRQCFLLPLDCFSAIAIVVQGGAAKSGSVFEPFGCAHAAKNWRGKSCTWFACSSAIYWHHFCWIYFVYLSWIKTTVRRCSFYGR